MSKKINVNIKHKLCILTDKLLLVLYKTTGLNSSIFQPALEKEKKNYQKVSEVLHFLCMKKVVLS